MQIPLETRSEGLYCPEGDFYIDAWSPVPVCLVTHAHGDHAHPGHGLYICSELTVELLKHRLGTSCNIKTYPYHQKFKIKNCWISFHSAGHILGSSQIRIETKNNICVVSGDYKRALDPTCEPFELIPCDIFVSESTFALPIYHWEPSDLTAKKIYNWWQENSSQGISSVLFCYALGKAQRILALLTKFTDSPLYVHGAIFHLSEIYQSYGIQMLPFLPIEANKEKKFSTNLILAPPLAIGSPWLKRFYPYKTAFASGWMQVRGTKKRKKVDQGFVLSDHADWQDLLKTIDETGAKTILTTHGNSYTLARFLRERQKIAYPLHGMEILEEGEG